VHPLEVDVWHGALQLFSELDSILLGRELSTLHRKSSHDESLTVFLNLLLAEANLELELQFLE